MARPPADHEGRLPGRGGLLAHHSAVHSQQLLRVGCHQAFHGVGGATFLGSAVVAAVRPWGGNVGVVWAFVVLYAAAFVMTYFLKVEQPRLKGGTITDGGTEEEQPAS